jgi:hypothetical protein
MAWNRTGGRRVFVTARSAQLLDSKDAGATVNIELMLHNGTALEERIDGGAPSVRPTI